MTEIPDVRMNVVPVRRGTYRVSLYVYCLYGSPRHPVSSVPRGVGRGKFRVVVRTNLTKDLNPLLVKGGSLKRIVIE